MRKCNFCGKSLDGEHKNRKYCSTKCYEKARYHRCGQRATKEQLSEWYKGRKKKNGYIEKLRQQAKDRKLKIKQFLDQYKMDKGCVDCGYKKHPEVLEFDHTGNNKKINVSLAKSIEQAKKEIEKCEIVCANCHRVRTYNRRISKQYPCKPDIFEMTYEPMDSKDNAVNDKFDKWCSCQKMTGCQPNEVKCYECKIVWFDGHKAGITEGYNKAIKEMENKHLIFPTDKYEQIKKDAVTEALERVEKWARNEPVGYRQYSTVDLLEFILSELNKLKGE